MFGNPRATQSNFPPAVYVVEALRIESSGDGFSCMESRDDLVTRPEEVCIGCSHHGAPDTTELFDSLGEQAVSFHESIRWVWGPGITFQEYVAKWTYAALDPRDFPGEFLRLRKVESQEVFSSTRGVLLLDADGIAPITGDMAQDVLCPLHGQELPFGELELILFEAAWEMMFQHLRADFAECYPTRSAELLSEAVTDVLRGRALINMDRCEILELVPSVIQAVADQCRPS